MKLRVWDSVTQTVTNYTATSLGKIHLGTGPFKIGKATSDTEAFDGLLDEVVIFNRILSDIEIDAIRSGTYDGPIVVPGNDFSNEPACVAWYRMEALTDAGTAQASASSENSSSYAAWKAMDRNAATYWRTAALSAVPSWLRFSWGADYEKTVVGYSIQCNGANEAPRDWTFEGYDGADWDVLDTRTGVTWLANETKSYSFSNTTAYQAYRVNISANNGGSTTDIIELTMEDAGGVNILPILMSNSITINTAADSHDSNPLEVFGGAIDPSNYQEGAGSLELEVIYLMQAQRLDAGLSSDFPLKNGTTNKSFTVCGFCRLKTAAASYYRWQWSKGNTGVALVQGNYTYGFLDFAGGTLNIVHQGDPIIDNWYFIALTYDDATRNYRLHVYDVDNDQNLGGVADTTGTVGGGYGAITLNGSPFKVGCPLVPTAAGQNRLWDGFLDEIVVLNRAVSAAELRIIRMQRFPGWVLNLTIVGDGDVTLDPDVDLFGTEEEVELLAEPDPDWGFEEWSGDLSGSANPETLSMDSDKDVTCTFEEQLPPEKPINSDPANGEVNVAVDKTMSWEDGGRADTFDVYIGTGPDSLVLVSSEQVGLSYNPPSDLVEGRIYYWRIDATNEWGTTTGDVWSFATISSIPYILAFPAMPNIKESLKWNTQILRGADGSPQRIAHLIPPRQGIVLPLLCNGDDEAEWLLSYIHNQLKSTWAVPIWFEAEFCNTALAIGETELFIDTNYADYRANSIAMVYYSRNRAELVEIDSVAADRLNIDPGLTRDYPDGAWIMPCRNGFVDGQVTGIRVEGDLRAVHIPFTILDNVVITGYVADMTYDGYTVLLKPHHFVEKEDNEIHDPEVIIADAMTGAVEAVSQTDFNQIVTPYAWRNDTKARSWEFRQWLHSIVGRQKAFLVPTYRSDFVLSRICGAADTSIYVTNRGRTQFVGVNDLRTYLAFRASATTIVPRKIVGMSVVDDDEERIDLNAAPGQIFAAGTSLCWLDRCTLAVDTVEMEWHYRGRNTGETMFMRVSQ
jgi:hypothetical protein